MDIMLILQIIVLLGAIYLGVRLGGIGIGYAGGAGVLVLGLGLGMKPSVILSLLRHGKQSQFMLISIKFSIYC